MSKPECFGGYLSGNIAAERDCGRCFWEGKCYDETGLRRLKPGPLSVERDPAGLPPHAPGAKLAGNLKDTNPKDALASNKLPLHLWPTTASAMGCLGMLEGLTKYGRCNFRDKGVLASVYVAACKRHLDAWFEGEEVAPDSGVPHLANALSCLAILVDADAAGKLIDDRNFNGTGYRGLVERLTKLVPQIRARFEGHNPRHFTIADNEATSPAGRHTGAPDAAPEQAATEENRAAGKPAGDTSDRRWRVDFRRRSDGAPSFMLVLAGSAREAALRFNEMQGVLEEVHRAE
jgi:hypothetical protein